MRLQLLPRVIWPRTSAANPAFGDGKSVNLKRLKIILDLFKNCYYILQEKFGQPTPLITGHLNG